MANRKGFTLIELLLVVSIVFILGAIVFVALNPAKQDGDLRDSKRRSDVNEIINALYQHAMDNNGDMPAGIPTGVPKEICMTNASCNNGVDLDVITGSYLDALPADPLVTSGTGTDYMIVRDPKSSRITVTAPRTEQEADPINSTR